MREKAGPAGKDIQHKEKEGQDNMSQNIKAGNGVDTRESSQDM
jgi:hypothetical protein